MAAVNLLLASDKVDRDIKENDGWTSLSWAAENGHEVVVKLLVEQDDVEADPTGRYSRTPLSRATEKGHEAVVLALLARDGIDWTRKITTARRRCLRRARGGGEGAAGAG